MHLKTFSLRGFKSFATPTTMNFEPGVTCIVGPNGSGKSNILDALVWVMGEQGAKSLRGGKMEDVIFAGTAGRPPQSSAEVSLTIDNSDGALPIPYSEVTLARTIFRSGGSEYALNGAPCRLLDIQELLADAGVGREMSVVGQGRLDSVLRATAEERRGFIEEAAGVLKHRKRKEKALRRLDQMQGNLSRLADLTSELGRQLGPLRRQADAARRAKAVQREVSDAQLRLLAHDIVTLQAEVEADKEKGAVLREQIAAADTALSEARERLARLNAESSTAATAAAEAVEAFHVLTAERERLRGARSLAQERVRLLSAPEPSRSGQDIAELTDRHERARVAEADLVSEAQRAEELVRETTTARKASEESVSQVEKELAALQREEAERRERLVRLETQVATRRARVESTVAELARFRCTFDEAEAAAARAEGMVAAGRSYVTEAEKELAEVTVVRDATRAEVDAARTGFDEATRFAAEAEKTRAIVETRMQMLTASLMRKDGADAVLSANLPGVLGKLSEHVSVEPGFESAIAAALGHLVDAVAVPDTATAARALRMLRDTDAGQAKLVVAHQAVAEELEDTLTTDPLGYTASRAVAFVTPTTQVGVTVKAMLTDVVIVDDLVAAERFLEANPRLTAVTKEGDLLSHGHAWGGSDAAPSTLHLQAQLDEARAELTTATQAAAATSAQAATARRTLEEAKAVADIAATQLRDAEVTLARVVKEHDRLVAAHRGALSDVKRATLAIDQTSTRLSSARTTLAEAEEQLAAAPGVDTNSSTIREMQVRRDTLQREAGNARSAETEARLTLRTAEERHRSAVARTASAARAVELERQACRQAEQRAVERAAQVEQARTELTEAEAALTRLASDLDVAEHHRASVQTVAAEKRAATDAARDDVDKLDADVRSLTETAHKDDVTRAQLELRLEQAQTRATTEHRMNPSDLVTTYGPNVPVVMMDPDTLTARPGSRGKAPASQHTQVQAHHKDVEETIPDGYIEVLFDRAEQETRLANATRALAKIGTVNPLALEEYSKLETRHGVLSEQLTDLRRTRQELFGIIEQIDERIQQVFSEVFTDVATQFEKVFSRLFPGGEGRLVLTDPTDLLNTGIEVEARPAGKMVKRLTLLSGGERSLVAVAFLVSIFKARPSPFLIMDEVEAALDDTNLGRLLDIFRELQENSQLIVITHQKRTMEVADALYGVAMRGDGVSTVISRRLN